MLIQIDKLKRRPRQIEIDEPASGFTVLHELVDQGVVDFKDRIRGTLTASWAGQIIEVSGHLNTTVTSSCGRCLKPVTSHLEIELLLCYSDLSDDEGAVAEELEIQREDLGLIGFSGTEIDLRPDIEQDIIMALPQQLLCAENCRGLCPSCGIDLNQDQCRCERPVFHTGLAALKNFRIE
ncbi:MAG: DUF177 domain-containing protein [Desulfuromonadales bacterium]